MRTFIIIIVLCLCVPMCFAEVKVFRYIEKSTGNEMGVTYSDKDGNPPIKNPLWDCIEIKANDMQTYIDLQSEQFKQRQLINIDKEQAQKLSISDKLSKIGLTQEEIDVIIK